MAPEVMEQLGGYNTKADIWSFGITMLELAKGFAPYAKHPPIKVMLKTLQEDPPSLKTYKTVPGQRFSRHFKEVVQLCLQRDPKRRYDARTAAVVCCGGDGDRAWVGQCRVCSSPVLPLPCPRR